MQAQANELLPLAAKIAREFANIPKLSHAAITTLREKLETMGFNGLDTLGLLKSAPHGGCGVPAAGRDSGVSPPVGVAAASSPQAVMAASRRQSSPQVDDFPPHP